MPGSKSRESEARSDDSGSKVKIIDETSLTCTCDYQPWACQACDFEGWVGQGAPGGPALSEREAVIRKRFSHSDQSEAFILITDQSQVQEHRRETGREPGARDQGGGGGPEDLRL